VNNAFDKYFLVGATVFLLAVPFAALTAAQMKRDQSRLRPPAFVLLLLLAAFLTSDAATAAAVCAAAALEFEATLFVAKRFSV
jgi:hypothetical protein